MARATFSQPSARPRNTPLLLTAVGLAILFGLRLAFSGPAATVIGGVQWFLEYYAGVFTLVALSITVMAGLVATDRLVLTARQRILLQAVHRGTALASMTFLGIHVALKILEGHASFVDVLVPFLSAHQVLFIGFGTIASYLMIIAAWTGVIRGRFAGKAHPGLWRALHASAYLAWPFALEHGLNAGRAPKPWVTISYVACVVFVLLALLVRVCLTWGKRRRAPKATTSGTIRAVGKPVPRPAPELVVPPPRRKPAPLRREPRREPAASFLELAGPLPEPAPYPDADPYLEPAAPRRKPRPPRWEPAAPHREPTAPQHEPALPAGGRRHEESGFYGARGPVSRGRLARATRAGDGRLGDGRPRPGVDMTDPGMPRYRAPEEPVTAQPAARSGRSAYDGGNVGSAHSQELPRLTFLDETDEAESTPRHGRHAAWDERDPYHTSAHPTVGRHSGEYRMLEHSARPSVGRHSGEHKILERTGAHPTVGRHSGEYRTLEHTGDYRRPAWQLALEAGPTQRAYEPADEEPAPRVRAEEPVSAVPAEPPRTRRRRRAVPELPEPPEMTETPNDLPTTRKAAVVLTDEEFWAHMRGEALR